MNKWMIFLPVILNFLVISCASAGISESRTAYIMSRDHGWIELSINDNAIPPRPPGEKEQNYMPTPPYCSVTVSINNEEFIRESVYPYGEQPPYRLNTGFKFPVPTGDYNVEVIYSGCRFAAEGQSAFKYTAHVNIAKNYVTPLQFDGNYVSVGNQFENTQITLEDINNRLNEIEQGLKAN